MLLKIMSLSIMFLFFFYSLGNFISSQPEDFRTESVGISLEFDGAFLMNINCIPFKTEKDDKKYFTKVVIINPPTIKVGFFININIVISK